MRDKIQLAITTAAATITAVAAAESAIENNNRELRVLFKIPVAI